MCRKVNIGKCLHPANEAIEDINGILFDYRIEAFLVPTSMALLLLIDFDLLVKNLDRGFFECFDSSVCRALIV